MSTGSTINQWYVVYTKARAEKKVDAGFKELGFETFCPTQKVLRQWSDRKKYIEQVLFTSYVFVKCLPADFAKFFEVQGFSRVVYYLGRPAVVREEEIRAVKIFLEQATDHSIHFEVNERVTIVDGPMKGKSGKVERIGRNKIRVRIEELNLNLVAEIHKNKVKALSV